MILVVDDDPSHADLMRINLQREGYDVAVADCLEAVKRETAKASPAAAVCDFYLGLETGSSIAEWLHQQDPDCAVIITSGDVSPKAAAEAIRSGAFDYLIKPVDDRALYKRVGHALEWRQSRRARRRLEEENRIIRERLAAVLDAVGEGLICVDGEHRVQEINRFARELFLAGGEAGLGASLTEVWPTVPESVRNALDVVIGSGRPVSGFLVTSSAPPLLGKALIVQAEPVALPAPGPSGRPTRGALLCLRDVTRLKHLESVLGERHHYYAFIGRSPAMQELYDNLKLAANSESTVLLTGESGTGKELAAAALHYESRRADKPFLKINCAALPESLLESELFGHTRGAFTGAITTRKGVFEAANGGTLFLDEIGDISPRLQLSLLRVIETKTFERIGDVRPQKVDVRLITATNADLRQRVKEGRFREDLFYRLNVVIIELPPLRRRGTDISLLADFFVARLAERLDRPIPRFAPETYQVLQSHSWPGNVRQLENALEQAVIFCREDVLMPHHLPQDVLDSVSGAAPRRPPETYAEDGGKTPEAGARPRRRIDQKIFREAMEACAWNQSEAARLLGLNRSTVWRMMKRWGETQ